jgi:YVTN family beta-propeller protein
MGERYGQKRMTIILVGSFLITFVVDLSNLIAASPVGDVLIKVGVYLQGITYDPAKGEIFVGNRLSDAVSVILEGNNTLIANVKSGSNPVSLAYDSSRSEAFVTNYASDS